MLAAEVIIPQMFTAYAEDLGYLRNGLHHIQYLCESCGQAFTAAWGKKAHSMQSYEKGDIFHCPHCKKEHEKHVVRIDRDMLAPNEVRLSVKTYKDSVDLEVYATTVQFSDLLTVLKVKYKEVWRFHIPTQTVKLTRYENSRKTEWMEIGNPFDLSFLDKSILAFFQTYSLGNTNYRPELVRILKVLRAAVREKLERKLGHKVPSMHISSGQWYGVFLAPLFNIAYRLTFPDAPNLPAIYREPRKEIEHFWLLGAINDHWLMDEVIKLTKQKTDLVTALVTVYSLPNKPVVRGILGENPFETGLLTKAFSLCQNYDYALRLWAGFRRLRVSTKYIFLNDDLLQFLRKMHNIYGEAGVVQMVEHANEINLSDCMRLYEQLNDENRRAIKTERVSVSDLHDWMAHRHRLQTHVNLKFKVPEHIVKRLSMQTDRMQFFLPKESVELLEAGSALHNCVAAYGKSMKDNSRWVVLVADDKGKLAACLEVQGKDLVQAKIDKNRPASTDPKLNAEIIAWAKEAKLVIKTSDLKVREDTVSMAV